jgi:hypothetical protein
MWTSSRLCSGATDFRGTKCSAVVGKMLMFDFDLYPSCSENQCTNYTIIPRFDCTPFLQKTNMRELAAGVSDEVLGRLIATTQ